MDNSNLNFSTINKGKNGKDEAQLGKAADKLLEESKKYANELYEQGVEKIAEAQQSIKQYSDGLIKTIHQNPITSVLVATGVGMLISSLFRRW